MQDWDWKEVSSGRRIFNSSEIAKLAGVSRSTVSRVINGYSNVSQDKREKILEIIRQYEYTPNSAARVLTGKKTSTIGLFFVVGSPGINYFKDDIHAGFMLASIAEAASNYGFFTLINIMHRMREPGNIKMVKEIFYQKRIDAGIFIGCSDNEPVIEELIKEGFVVGILDYDVYEREELGCVVANFDDKCAEQAVDYLVSLGHEKIMAVHGDLRRYSGKQRYQAFIRAMKKHGLEIRKEWMLFPGFERFRAYNMMNEFLSQNGREVPTAIFCANDTIAYGVMDALKQGNLVIPNDVSVIGIDDSSFSAYTDPPLTTFRVDFQEVLGTLTRKVVECVNTDSTRGVVFEFGGELVIRDSCTALKRSA